VKICKFVIWSSHNGPLSLDRNVLLTKVDSSFFSASGRDWEVPTFAHYISIWSFRIVHQSLQIVASKGIHPHLFLSCPKQMPIAELLKKMQKYPEAASSLSSCNSSFFALPELLSELYSAPRPVTNDREKQQRPDRGDD
jgi:hypothetical protein